MRQQLLLPLALLSVFCILFLGVVAIRSFTEDSSDAYTRPTSRIKVGTTTKIDTELNKLWDSVGWLGKGVPIGSEIKYAYIETVWAIGTDKTNTYFATCLHGPLYAGFDDLYVGYWDYKMQRWATVPCTIVAKLSKSDGDLAIAAVATSSLVRPITPLKVAREENFNINDEILISGVQPSSGPAFVCIGVVKMLNMRRPEFMVRGWAWFGFSGGPVVLRRTGEVIGFIRAATYEHAHDASESICGDYSLILKLLSQSHMENILK